MSDFWPRKGALHPLRQPVALAVVGLLSAAAALHAINEKATDAISHRDLAAFTLSRASQQMMMAPYAVLSLLTYDDDTEAGRTAPVLYLDAMHGARQSLDSAMELAPDKAAEIGRFKDRFDALVEKAKAPLVVANAAPGLTRGANLTAADLGQLAEVARSVAEINTQMQKLADDVDAFDSAFVAENLTAGDNLDTLFDVSMLIVLTVAFAALAYLRTAFWQRLEVRLNLGREAEGAPTGGETGERGGVRGAPADWPDPSPEFGGAAPLGAKAESRR